MSDENTDQIPREIKLHQRTRTLELTFNDSSRVRVRWCSLISLGI